MGNVEKELKSAIKEAAISENFDIKDDAFRNKNDKTESKKEEKIIKEDDINDESNDIITEDKDSDIDIENELLSLSMTTDDLEEAILDISEVGTYKRKVSIFNGKISAVFETSDTIATREYTEFFAERDFKLQSEVDYYITLFSLASILKEYQGSSLQGTLVERSEIIEKNIKGVVFTLLLKKAEEFHSFIDLLLSEEVEYFLQQRSI